MSWEEMAHYITDVYGNAVDWEERFFICPECGEPIYECDYENDGALKAGYCPVCGFAINEEECELENYFDKEEEDDENMD